MEIYTEKRGCEYLFTIVLDDGTLIKGYVVGFHTAECVECAFCGRFLGTIQFGPKIIFKDGEKFPPYLEEKIASAIEVEANKLVDSQDGICLDCLLGSIQ